MRTFMVVLLSALAAAPFANAQDCEFHFWREYQGDRLMRHATADAYLVVTDHMRIDADGAPNAYHPDDTGLDFLANAGYPNQAWWPSVLVPDPTNPSVPFIQRSGTFAGYFVSKTALHAPGLPETDPDRYVDATSVPYLVFPGAFAKRSGTGRLGDLGFAVNLETGSASPFIVADVGPTNAKLGEVSIALAQGLGGVNVNPRTGAGAPGGETVYVIFRFSSARSVAGRWPLSSEQIASRVDELVASIGGREHIEACVG
jgi:hypothetical protein